MGTRFKQGSVWSDGATTPAGKALTVGYVAGDSMFISRETDLFVWCTVTGTAPTSVDFQLHTSTDGTNWETVAIPGRATITGDAMLRFNDLKSDVYYRLSAKRTGGDATTKLLALGYVSPIDAAPLPVGTGGGVVLEGYSPTTGATSVDLQYVAGTATNVNGGVRDAGTQTVTLADDDPAVVDLAAIEVLETTIAGDTTSIDGKTPALGSAAMAGSVPVTVATDDTQFGSVGASSDVDGNVHGQLRYIGEALDGARAPSEQTLVDVTNLTTNTTFNVDFEMDNYRYFSLQGIFSAVPTTDTLTVTILGKVGDGQFEDITAQLFPVASWIDDFTAICDTPCPVSDIRVQYVTSNDAGGDCDLKLTLKRMW